MLRIAVVGHVEHITLAAVKALPGPGEISHLQAPRCFPGGGGGIALYQLLASDADEVHAFTALGHDDAGAFVRAELERTRAQLHLAQREAPHTRDLVLIPPGGDRVILVVGKPLHVAAGDDLPYRLFAQMDAVYFTGEDAEVLRQARAAKRLLVTARRQHVLAQAGVEADVVIGSVSDPKEQATRTGFAVPPRAVVMTEGARGGYVETKDGRDRFPPPPPVKETVGTYGAGDSFAGAVTYFLASGCSALEAATRAGPFGGAVLAGLNPLEHQRKLTA